jgi:hypothetical protein
LVLKLVLETGAGTAQSLVPGKGAATASSLAEEMEAMKALPSAAR